MNSKNKEKHVMLIVPTSAVKHSGDRVSYYKAKFARLHLRESI